MRENPNPLKTRKVGTEERKNVCPKPSLLQKVGIDLFLRSYILTFSIFPLSVRVCGDPSIPTIVLTALKPRPAIRHRRTWASGEDFRRLLLNVQGKSPQSPIYPRFYPRLALREGLR